MSLIKTLKKMFTGETVYPVTKINAVYDENGNRLDELLKHTLNESDTIPQGYEVQNRYIENKSTKEIINPITSTSAIYDEDGNRLDNKLNELNENLNVLNSKLVKKISTSNLLVPKTTFSQGLSYTATCDCWVIANLHVLANYQGEAYSILNDVYLIEEITPGACNYWSQLVVPIKKSDTIYFSIHTNATDSWYKVLRTV